MNCPRCGYKPVGRYGLTRLENLLDHFAEHLPGNKYSRRVAYQLRLEVERAKAKEQREKQRQEFWAGQGA